MYFVTSGWGSGTGSTLRSGTTAPWKSACLIRCTAGLKESVRSNHSVRFLPKFQYDLIVTG